MPAVPAPPPPDEPARLAALRRYGVLDTAPEPDFDDIAALASHICGTPIALVSLVDENRQWFKARVGHEDTESDRDRSFCAHAILGRDVMEVPDALRDPRFATNPSVTGPPDIRFYAGAPLVTPDGHALGSLCVIDRAPRALGAAQLVALEALARQVVSRLEARRVNSQLVAVVDALEEFAARTAHDLKAPLVAVSGYADLLRTRWEALDPATRDELLRAIGDRAVRASREIDVVLEHARSAHYAAAGETDAERVAREVVDAAALDDAVVTISGEWRPVAMPESEVRTIFANLVGNAGHYGRRDGKLRLTLSSQAADGWVTIVARDEGHGLPADLDGRAFEPFVHGAGSDAVNPSSTGLGLALVRRTAERWGGRATIDSSPAGVAVTLRFPAAPAG